MIFLSIYTPFPICLPLRARFSRDFFQHALPHPTSESDRVIPERFHSTVLYAAVRLMLHPRALFLIPIRVRLCHPERFHSTVRSRTVPLMLHPRAPFFRVIRVPSPDCIIPKDSTAWHRRSTARKVAISPDTTKSDPPRPTVHTYTHLLNVK